MITTKVLIEAIQLSRDLATDHDEIHYQMLNKHLHSNVLEALLTIFNGIWETGFQKDGV